MSDRNPICCFKLTAAGIGLCLGMLSVSAAGQTTKSDGPARSIDLSHYQLTFDEPFEKLSVSAWGSNTRWIAHTPWNGDFGDADFVDPQKDFPFTVKNGALRIELRKNKQGNWQSGLLASVDKTGEGFSQMYGYFEIRTKFTAGAASWPAFWLIGLDRLTQNDYTAEVDIFEHIGTFPKRFKSAIHVWDRTGQKKSHSRHKRIFVPENSLYDRFNTYGVSITERHTTIYFNRSLVWSTATPKQLRQPMFILLNLGLGSGFPIDRTPSPSFMYVDYVRAWQPAEPQAASEASARNSPTQ